MLRRGRTPAVIGVAAALIGAAGCTSAGHGTTSRAARITATPQVALVDAPVDVEITGLPRGANTTVNATVTDAAGHAFGSDAHFLATDSGAVSLGQFSVGGSYSGVNPMGLFELLRPTAADSNFVSASDGFTVTLTAAVNGKAVATTTVVRQSPKAAGVVEHDIRPASGGVYGDVFLPARAASKMPGVLVIGGSEGGLATADAAALLAAHGYPALALAYFAEPGLPSTLTDIPLEYFASAARILAGQPGVDPARLVAWGTSRGSEAAQLLGAYYPQLIHAVVASVPSSVIGPGLPDISKPAWTFDGKPLPSVPTSDLGNPDPADAPASVIPDEKIDGPIFLVCAGEDQVWPSCAYSDAIVNRLQAHGSAHPHQELRYPTAGHGIGALVPYSVGEAVSFAVDGPTSNLGSVAANQAGRADAWPKLLSFLAAQ